MFRRVTTVTVLAAAVGGPYLASETEFGREALTSVTSVVTSDSNSDHVWGNGTSGHALHEIENLRRQGEDRFRYGQELVSTKSNTAGEPSKGPMKPPKLVGARVDDLREVIRFDITPNWVIGRFARVTTVLADMHLEGMRVPVVTGTQPDDLAGTLTYYFDHHDKLQRVTIHGFTGDPNRLVNGLTSYFGLTREPSLEAGVFTKRWNGLPLHFLRLTHAPVVHADALHNKYTLFLELNDPNLAYGISREARRIVESDRMSGRW